MDSIWGINNAPLSYEGEWRNGRPHGNGKLVFQDGAIYVGEFFESNFHGKGNLTSPIVGEMIGEWENGILKEGTKFSVVGTKFSGKFNKGYLYSGVVVFRMRTP